MYKFRLKILLGVIAALLLAVLVRLSYMQLVHGEEYRHEAELALQSFEFPQAQRGRIFDRNGLVLAEDRPLHDLCLEYRFITRDPRWIRWEVRSIARAEGLDVTDDVQLEQAREIYREREAYTRQLLEMVAEEIGQDLDANIREVEERIRRWREHSNAAAVAEERMAHPVLMGLDEDRSDAIRPLLDGTVGLSLVPSSRRVYPFDSLACHIIGITTPVYREDAEAHNLTPDQADWVTRMRFNYRAGDRIGKNGVEGTAEDFLRPRRGMKRYSSPGVLAEEIPARPGRDIHLTIDIELQRRLTSLLAGSGFDGAIVVLDVDSGDVLALVSWPVYDLNTYFEQYKHLTGDLESRIHRPLIHRAVGGVYPPGSTVKPIVGCAGLASGAITLHTPLNCPGYVRMTAGGPILRCWKRSGHGTLEVVEAIKHSCTVFFPRVADRLGTERLLNWLELFGFNHRPGTGLAEESSGMLGTADYLRRARHLDRPYNRPHYPSDKWFMSVGQGLFAATPLQVANAHATIARDGVFLSPRLVLENFEGGPRQEKRILPISEEHVSEVRRGMYRVVNEPGGTAYRPWHIGPSLGFEICGKTGTAQAPTLKVDTDGDGERDTVVHEGRDHSWFAGFGPYREPQVVVTVLAEYAGSGGAHAAPIAKDVFRICSEMGYIRNP